VTATSLRLSILDLASLHREQDLSDIYADSVALARRAEELGYLRVWYGEHHNIPGMASSAIIPDRRGGIATRRPNSPVIPNFSMDRLQRQSRENPEIRQGLSNGRRAWDE